MNNVCLRLMGSCVLIGVGVIEQWFVCCTYAICRRGSESRLSRLALC
jgi:hypothetical protein